MIHLDLPDSFEEATMRVEALAQALHDVLVADGVINPSVPCDGPTLLMVAEDYVEHTLSLKIGANT